MSDVGEKPYASADAEYQKPTAHLPRVHTPGYGVSPEALAAGDLHNILVSRFSEVFQTQGDPQPLIAMLIKRARAQEHLTAGEAHQLRELIVCLSADKEDFGLAEARDVRTRIVDAESGDFAMTIASIAVGSVDFWLRDLSSSGAPQAARKKRFWTALADIGGGILGFFAGGGIGGAVAGGAIASGFAARFIPDDPE